MFSLCQIFLAFHMISVSSQVLEEVLHNLEQDGTMSIEDFFYGLLRNGKSLTPSASTPYRQLKRHLSMQVREGEVNPGLKGEFLNNSHPACFFLLLSVFPCRGSCEGPPALQRGWQ